MNGFFSPSNIYQLISNLGIFVLFGMCLFLFRKIQIAKDGITVEKDAGGNSITLKTINDKMEKRFNEIEKEFAAIKENDIIQSNDILGIKFYLQKLPNEPKLASGLRYLKNGGNGQTRDDIKKFVNSHQELYNAIIALEPSLRLKD